jgi:hypothetical protein
MRMRHGPPCAVGVVIGWRWAARRLDAPIEDLVGPDLVSYYRCEPCEVLGADPALEPACWCCAGPVRVTARVTEETRWYR